jgi:hypothetical protein
VRIFAPAYHALPPVLLVFHRPPRRLPSRAACGIPIS